MNADVVRLTIVAVTAAVLVVAAVAGAWWGGRNEAEQ